MKMRVSPHAADSYDKPVSIIKNENNKWLIYNEDLPFISKIYTENTKSLSEKEEDLNWETRRFLGIQIPSDPTTITVVPVYHDYGMRFHSPYYFIKRIPQEDDSVLNPYSFQFFLEDAYKAVLDGSADMVLPAEWMSVDMGVFRIPFSTRNPNRYRLIEDPNMCYYAIKFLDEEYGLKMRDKFLNHNVGIGFQYRVYAEAVLLIDTLKNPLPKWRNGFLSPIYQEKIDAETALNVLAAPNDTIPESFVAEVEDYYNQFKGVYKVSKLNARVVTIPFFPNLPNFNKMKNL